MKRVGTELAPILELDDTSHSVKRSKTPSTFLGQPLNKLDIDEVQVDEELKNSSRGPLGKLTALSLAIPTTQKSLRTYDQTVRDEQGRRRFHGAFTGGFSAGYFNTVGTAEGWTPGTFQSSRRGKKDSQRSNRLNRVEDYMDAEDIENMTSGRATVSLVSSLPETRHKPEPQDAFDRLFTGETESRDSGPLTGSGTTIYNFSDAFRAGFNILRSMGWRTTSDTLMTTVLRRPPKHVMEASTSLATNSNSVDASIKPYKRVIGPQLLPPGLTRKTGKSESFKKDTLVQPERSVEEDEDYDDAWRERKRQIFSSLMIATKSLRTLKSDRYGLGFHPKEPLFSTQMKEPEISFKKKEETYIRGGGFGIGALEEEEDWEQEYLNFNEETKREVKQQAITLYQRDEDEDAYKKSNDNRTSYKERHRLRPWQTSDGQDLYEFADEATEKKKVDDNLNTSVQYLLTRYTVPSSPPSWKNYHTPSEAEYESEKKLRSGHGASSIVALLVEHLKKIKATKNEQKLLPSEKILPAQSTSDFATEAARRKHELSTVKVLDTTNKDQHDDGNLSTQSDKGLLRSKPLWSRVTDDTKKAMIASLTTSKFVKPSFNDCSTLKSNRLNVIYPDDNDKQKRYELFCLALDEKIPASIAFDHTNKNNTEAVQERKEFGKHYTEFRLKHPSVDFINHCSPETMAVVDVHNKYISRPDTIKPRYTRITYNWKPDPLLCKRLKLRDPWEKRSFIDNRPLSLAQQQKSDSLSTSDHNNRKISRKPESRSQSFVNEVAAVLGIQTSNTTIPLSSTEEKLKEDVSEENVCFSTQIELKMPRPPMNIFQAVFADMDDDDDI